jgi:hypothetical protein
MVAASIERADGVVEVFAFSHDDSLLLVKGFAGCLIEHGHKTAKHLFGNIIWPEE